MMLSRSVTIASVDSDMTISASLCQILKDWVEDELEVAMFNLNGGALVADILASSVAEARWFLLLLSRDAVESQWVKTEANLATIQRIEEAGFKLVVVRLDKTEYPQYLRTALKGQLSFDLTDGHERETKLMQIADYIENTRVTHSWHEVYVDRGDDADRFALLARRNKIIFILGWAGIGKSAFVVNSATHILRKRPLIVPLTRGHSIDLLSRQILQAARAVQPIDGGKVSEPELLESALDVLTAKSDGYFLFIDNAEEGLDTSNQLRPYLELFLAKFIKAGIDTHVVIATTRNPDYSAEIGNLADLFRLGGLEDLYIRECIDLWLEGTKQHSQLMNMPEMADLVDLVGGHPQAAKMMASYLKIKTPQQLLLSRQRKRFQMKFAEYILRSVDQGVLSDLHRLFLQILATVREPLLLEDMLRVQELQRYTLDEVHEVRSQLSDWFLIEQAGELISLHDFLGAYFRDQLDHMQERRYEIASSIGHYAYEKATKLNRELPDARTEQFPPGNETVVRVSNEIFRYAVSAGKLLRSIGEDGLAEQLPIQIRGTLREMVFYFYQEKKDYGKTLSYAEAWLKIDPNDLEIMLYQARSHRCLGDKHNASQATNILDRLERKKYNKRFAEKLCRERALLAQDSGDIEAAKHFYRQAIEIDTSYPYPENYTGLARLLLGEADEVFHEGKRLELAREAVSLLETAREASDKFDRYHLGTYVEALIQAGNEEIAFPLLEEALEDRPRDERLNFRMAEILRERKDYAMAERHALNAQKYGASYALLTLANIAYEQGVELRNQGRMDEAEEKFGQALQYLSDYKPQSVRHQEVADGTRAKIFRTLNDWPSASEAIDKYETTDNPYTIYEQCKIWLWRSEMAQIDGEYSAALDMVRSAITRIQTYKYDPPKQLIDLLYDARAKEIELEDL